MLINNENDFIQEIDSIQTVEEVFEYTSSKPYSELEIAYLSTEVFLNEVKLFWKAGGDSMSLKEFNNRIRHLFGILRDVQNLNLLKSLDFQQKGILGEIHFAIHKKLVDNERFHSRNNFDLNYYYLYNSLQSSNELSEGLDFKDEIINTLNRTNWTISCYFFRVYTLPIKFLDRTKNHSSLRILDNNTMLHIVACKFKNSMVIPFIINLENQPTPPLVVISFNQNIWSLTAIKDMESLEILDFLVLNKSENVDWNGIQTQVMKLVKNLK
jgi:hypothetical protein